MDKSSQIIGFFLVRTINCGIGGMESHQRAFISHFFNNNTSCDTVDFQFIIENRGTFFTVSKHNKDKTIICFQIENITNLISFIYDRAGNTPLLFLNDGWWIEYVRDFKELLPNCILFMRTGGNDFELAPWNQGHFSYLERRILWKNSLNSLDCLIANSDYSISLLKKLSVNQSIIKKVRGGVDGVLCKKFKDRKAIIKSDICQALKIRQKYILLFACRFVPFKGIIPAMSLLLQSNIHNDCHILLAGSGQLQSEIEVWCAENLFDNQYTILGELSNANTLRIMAASDILLNTSIECLTRSGDGFYIHTETMGRSIMEAVSVGTKVFATNVGGTGELFRENDGIGYLSDVDEQSMIKGFNDLKNIIGVKPRLVADYSWNNVFSIYNVLFCKSVQ